MTAAPRGEVQALCEVIHGEGGVWRAWRRTILRFHYARVQAQTFDSGCCLE